MIKKITKNSNFKIVAGGDYIFELAKPGVKLEVGMATKVVGQEILKVNLSVHHRAKGTEAHTTLKAVGQDESQIIIEAKILIDKACQQTKSFLTEKILLTSPKARATAIPNLEILNDDVTCSHSLSISKIPESQIFYLESRGLSRKKAKEMIVEGFLTRG